jgi:hypothetical protein
MAYAFREELFRRFNPRRSFDRRSVNAPPVSMTTSHFATPSALTHPSY